MEPLAEVGEEGVGASDGDDSRPCSVPVGSPSPGCPSSVGQPDLLCLYPLETTTSTMPLSSDGSHEGGGGGLAASPSKRIAESFPAWERNVQTLSKLTNLLVHLLLPDPNGSSDKNDDPVAAWLAPPSPAASSSASLTTTAPVACSSVVSSSSTGISSLSVDVPATPYPSDTASDMLLTEEPIRLSDVASRTTTSPSDEHVPPPQSEISNDACLARWGLVDKIQPHQLVYFTLTEAYYCLPQRIVAKMLQMPPSSFAKRWREATLSKRKWPHRRLRALHTRLLSALQNWSAILEVKEPTLAPSSESTEPAATTATPPGGDAVGQPLDTTVVPSPVELLSSLSTSLAVAPGKPLQVDRCKLALLQAGIPPAASAEIVEILVERQELLTPINIRGNDHVPRKYAKYSQPSSFEMDPGGEK